MIKTHKKYEQKVRFVHIEDRQYRYRSASLSARAAASRTAVTDSESTRRVHRRDPRIEKADNLFTNKFKFYYK